MKSKLLIAGLCCAALATAGDAFAQEGGINLGGRILQRDMATRGDTWAQDYAQCRPWHGNYYYLQYGQPLALVVPPTATMQSNYSWGVSQNTMTPTYHQYGPAAMPSAGGAFYATPIWPSHTRQFGVYPVRAPW